MEGKHPKRRRDKYNPYTICEKDGHYYIAFSDGQKMQHELEISRELYESFDEFELRDISYLHKWDKYEEHSELWEETLNARAFLPQESVEDIIFNKLLKEKLYHTIDRLSEIQKRRLILYYFDGLTYEEIARKEGCTKMPVKRSIDAALEHLKKEFM